MGQPKGLDLYSSLFAPTDSKVSDLMQTLAKASLKPELPLPFTSLFGTAEPNPAGIGSLFGTTVPEPPKPDGIRFYRDGGGIVEFMEPRPFSWEIPQPAWAGLYVILVADNSWNPRFFRPLYFGETEDLAKRPTTSHEHYRDWSTAAGGAGNLHVAYCWMIGSTKDERTAIESGLIKHYQPECNTMYKKYSLSWRASGAVPGVPAGPETSPVYLTLLDLIRRSTQ
jgi:hypothetical protein